jgi:translation initiation factor 2D
MFKKAIEAKSHQRLSGADRKKLKRTIRDRFPRASDADIDALLPPKVTLSSISPPQFLCLTFLFLFLLSV